MMLNINQFWDENSLPPPINESIKNYHIESQIRKPTNYSYIYLASKIGDDQKKVIKFIKCKENIIERIINEIDTMNEIQHKYILKIEDYFLYNEYACIVTPYIPTGSLHFLILNKYKNGIPENIAKIMMEQMLDSIIYLHEINIWHRDIKPDNFLVADSDPKHPNVLLTDFGFAKRFEENARCNEFLCTPEFCAPEILNSIPYTNKVDVYSLGITLFVMLTGHYPTCSYSSNPSRCRELIKHGMLNYKLLEDKNISYDAINLIKSMCDLDPDYRITAKNARNHRWFEASDQIIDSKKYISIDKLIIQDEAIKKLLKFYNLKK